MAIYMFQFFIRHDSPISQIKSPFIENCNKNISAPTVGFRIFNGTGAVATLKEFSLNRLRIKENWRRERDLNPRYPFGVHTLSRRAPSTTRPSLRLLPEEGWIFYMQRIVLICRAFPPEPNAFLNKGRIARKDRLYYNSRNTVAKFRY